MRDKKSYLLYPNCGYCVYYMIQYKVISKKSKKEAVFLGKVLEYFYIFSNFKGLLTSICKQLYSILIIHNYKSIKNNKLNLLSIRVGLPSRHPHEYTQTLHRSAQSTGLVHGEASASRFYCAHE